jgi:acetyl esterase/lipase
MSRTLIFGTATFLMLTLVAAPMSPAAEAAGDLRVARNLPFTGKDDDKGLQSLDVYAPKTGSERPIMVWVHGGGWRKGDKAQVGVKPQAFVDKGFVFVSVNYRLVPAVTYKEQAHDVTRAIAWVHKHARDYGGDPNQIYLMGHSAGAQLAALVGTDDRFLKAAGLPLTTLKGVILLDGAAYDVPRRIEAGEPKEKPLFEEVFGKDAASQRDSSATTHVARGKGIPPFLIFHVAGRDLSRVQSEHLARLLTDAGVTAKVVPAEGKTHSSLSEDMGKPDDVPTRVVFEFLHGLGGKSGR